MDRYGLYSEPLSVLLDVRSTALLSDRVATAHSAADRAALAGLSSDRAHDVQRAVLMALWEWQLGEQLSVDEVCVVRCMGSAGLFVVEVDGPRPLKVAYWSLGRRTMSKLGMLVDLADGLEILERGRVCRLVFRVPSGEQPGG